MRRGREFLDPATGPPHERHRRHERHPPPAQREHEHEQAHIVVQRQPARSSDIHIQANGNDHLQHVGHHRAMGDLDAGGHSRRTRCVLQIGDVIGIRRHPHICRAHRVGHAVDGQDSGPTIARQSPDETADGFGGRLIGEHHRRLGIGEHRIEPLGVTRQFRGEKGHRDGPGLDGGEEADDVIEALRRQDRDPIPGLGHLLKPRRDRTRTRPQLGPVQVGRSAVRVTAEIDVAVGKCVVLAIDGTLQIMVDGIAIR